MSEVDVEITVTVDAESREEAIEKAREKISSGHGSKRLQWAEFGR